jgi:hypothetical protein
MSNIKRFDLFVNELSSQSATKGIENDSAEPSYSYGNIQDILGNKYNYTVPSQKLEEFEENILSKDETPDKNDAYFAKRYIEFVRQKFRLTPPFQDDLIQNNDFYAKAFYDEQDTRNTQNDIGKPVKGLQEKILNEDGVACATGGNTSGMGAVVTSQPSSIPGDVSGATTGSGDIGSNWGSVATKTSAYNNLTPTNRNVIPRKGNNKKDKIKKLAQQYANQFKGDEYKQGGDKDVAKMPNIKNFEDFIKSNK